jgi:hypothetical protein
MFFRIATLSIMGLLCTLTNAVYAAFVSASESSDALDKRIQTHSQISATLDRLTDEELGHLLESATSFHSGWGKSALLTIGDIKIFVR